MTDVDIAKLAEQAKVKRKTMDDKPYVQLGHGRAYSNKHGINVIMSHESNRDGNHFYPRARGKVIDAVQKRVEQLIRDIRAEGETLWPGYPWVRVTVREEYGVPGEYHWTAWDE